MAALLALIPVSALAAAWLRARPDGGQGEPEASVAAWLAMAVASVGASLVLVTVRLNGSLTATPLVSVAVSVMLTTPTSALAGVPLKVRVAALKLSHAGSALVV